MRVSLRKYILMFVVFAVCGTAVFSAQTSAQLPVEQTMAERMLRAEERQADALENLVRELRTTNARLQSMERRCR